MTDGRILMPMPRIVTTKYFKGQVAAGKIEEHGIVVFDRKVYTMGTVLIYDELVISERTTHPDMARHYRRMQQGQCRKCGTPITFDNARFLSSGKLTSECIECRKKANDKRRDTVYERKNKLYEWKKKHKLCVNVSCDEAAAPGRTYCKACGKRRASNMRRVTAARRGSGKCMTCGIDMNGSKTCPNASNHRRKK